jgi:DNA-binding MarR family transcriptional regulator
MPERVSDSAARAAREIKAVFSRLRRRLRELALEDDLTPSQTAALIRLAKDGPASASQLAGAERVRPQSMATTLAGLDRHGLIRREPDPDDGRRQLISLTPEGRRRAESDRKVRDEWLVRALQDRYTEQERRIIVDALSLLDRLTD